MAIQRAPTETVRFVRHTPLVLSSLPNQFAHLFQNKPFSALFPHILIHSFVSEQKEKITRPVFEKEREKVRWCFASHRLCVGVHASSFLYKQVRFFAS